MLLKKPYEAPEIHDKWESIYRDSPGESKLNDRIMARVLRILSPSGNALFLDAGCGAGDHAARIAQHGFRCVGMDISEHILKAALERKKQEGPDWKIEYLCAGLEQIPFSEGTFDVVHCRGVLMHVPEWEKALHSLCRALKPGGKIVVMETNHRSVEIALVKLVRFFVARESNVRETPGGLEFWSQNNGKPFLVRSTNLRYLRARLKKFGVDCTHTFSTGFFDIGRFPKGFFRNSAILLNRVWFAFRLPAILGMHVAIVGRKRN